MIRWSCAYWCCIYSEPYSCNVYRGGVAVYIQSHIPVMLREDLMSSVIEVLWLQVHLPHVKPIILGCFYRPPSANSQYLNNMCELLDSVCDLNRECYFIGHLPEY